MVWASAGNLPEQNKSNECVNRPPGTAVKKYAGTHDLPCTKWGKNTVNIVFLLAICEEDNLLFQDIFSFVTEFIADVKNMPALLSAKTYEEFLNTMISFFPE